LKFKIKFKSKKITVLLFTGILAATISAIIVVLFLTQPALFIYNYNSSMEKFTKNDRVLILAPHPDDEAIATGGVIQRALNAGAKVNIICFTNGDLNQAAFLVYEKKPAIFQKQFILLGETRRLESLKGIENLGLDKNDIKYLGYPDFGTLRIMLEYWDPLHPYRSPLSREEKVPYPESFSPDSPYCGESILNDLEKLISEFKPTKIFVSSPIDLNNDHKALYLFLQVALWDLSNSIVSPDVFEYIVHAKNWPENQGYYPLKKLTYPVFIKGDEIKWYDFVLTAAETEKKHEAVLNYKSQIAYKPKFLVSFVKSDEIFSKFKEIDLKDSGKVDLKWQKVDVHKDSSGKIVNSDFEDLSYAFKEKDLYLKLKLKHSLDEKMGIRVYLLGYRKDVDFKNMPKIQVKIGLTGVDVLDKKEVISGSKINLSYEGKDLIVRIPASVLGDPSYILSYVGTRAGDLSYDALAWRVLKLN
jgi:LmbE family N-acetylglucosaminyl deacetylase